MSDLHLSDPMQRTALAMHGVGFPLPAIDATVKAEPEIVRLTICEQTRVCAVPDCGAWLWSGNRSTVCQQHIHAPGFCVCSTCRRRRAMPRDSTPLSPPANIEAERRPSRTEKRAFYDSWEWRTLRMEALLANDGRCECCGLSRSDIDLLGDPVRLHVDHIKPLSRFWSLRLEASNLQVLCADCNQGKGGWDETDWRGGEPSPSAQIIEARAVLYACELAGDWLEIEAAHARLLSREHATWLHEKFGVGNNG